MILRSLLCLVDHVPSDRSALAGGGPPPWNWDRPFSNVAVSSNSRLNEVLRAVALIAFALCVERAVSATMGIRFRFAVPVRMALVASAAGRRREQSRKKLRQQFVSDQRAVRRRPLSGGLG